MKKNKSAKKKKQLIILVCILVLVIVLAGVFVVYTLQKNGVLPSGGDSDSKGYHELTSGENPEDIEIQVKSSDDYVEPAPGTLDATKIQGYTAQTTAQSGDTATESGEDGAASAPTITLSDSNLTVESIGRYSGSFLEDGSDEPTANVAAMLITNHSDQMLQIAQIDFQVNDTETASFKVTDLPAGTSTLVLESNKREFKEEDSYTYGNAATGYMEQPTLEEDKFDIEVEKGKITLKNKTNETYAKVYVYYKYVQLGGAYLGGITYRTPFEDVKGGAEVEAVAGHFNPESSKIMAVQVLDE